MSLGWGRADIPPQRGRRAIVTGANSGLGLATASALAGAGADVVMAVRSVAKGETAAATIRDRHPGATIRVAHLDLADLTSVGQFADRELEDADRLDLLINNAGIMATPPQLTPGGVELQFATNHLGHFALTGRLIGRLLATPGSRIVSVSSLAARSGSLADHDPTSLDGYERFGVYGATKLANQVFTAELDRRLRRVAARSGPGRAAPESAPIAVAAHPGLSATNLQQGFALGGLRQFAVDVVARIATQPASIGALPTLRAATDPDVSGGDYFGPSLPGQYYGPPRKMRLLPTATDLETGRRLWEQSIALSGVTFSELD